MKAGHLDPSMTCFSHTMLQAGADDCSRNRSIPLSLMPVSGFRMRALHKPSEPEADYRCGLPNLRDHDLRQMDPTWQQHLPPDAVRGLLAAPCSAGEC